MSLKFKKKIKIYSSLPIDLNDILRTLKYILKKNLEKNSSAN